MSTISFIVTGRDRYELLIKCLESVFNSSIIPNEVIYVDMGSKDWLPISISNRYKEVRIIRLGKVSPQTARNVGALASKGEIIAFCDDDVSLGNTTILTALSLFESYENVGACGFSVVSQWKTHAILDNKCGLITPFWFTREQKRTLPEGVFKVFTVRNLYIFERDTFFAIGGWDERIFINGEEPDIFYRLYHSGKRVLFSNKSSINDLAPEAKAHKIVDELGITRETLGVRNLFYSMTKLLSLPIIIPVMPLCFLMVAFSPFFPGTTKERWAGIRLYFDNINQALCARMEYGKRSFIQDIKLFVSLQLCENMTKKIPSKKRK